jgi:hypothetical protein
MRYSVEEFAKRFFVRDAVTRRQHGPYPTRQAANGAQQELEEQDVDPELAKRRQIGAAYRQVETPGTELHSLRKIFPRKGEIEKRTKAAYRTQPIFEGVDWDRIDELERAAARRRAALPATSGNRLKGTDTRKKVQALWQRLHDIVPRYRATRIAAELNLDPGHVRRLVRELRLK